MFEQWDVFYWRGNLKRCRQKVWFIIIDGVCFTVVVPGGGCIGCLFVGVYVIVFLGENVEFGWIVGF